MPWDIKLHGGQHLSMTETLFIDSCAHIVKRHEVKGMKLKGMILKGMLLKDMKLKCIRQKRHKVNILGYFYSNKFFRAVCAIIEVFEIGIFGMY